MWQLCSKAGSWTLRLHSNSAINVRLHKTSSVLWYINIYTRTHINITYTLIDTVCVYNNIFCHSQSKKKISYLKHLIAIKQYFHIWANNVFQKKFYHLQTLLLLKQEHQPCHSYQTPNWKISKERKRERNLLSFVNRAITISFNH